MINTTDSKLIDSSIWIAYLSNGDYKKEIENEETLLTSVISLIEIPRKLRKLKIPSEEIKKQIEFINHRSILKEVTKEIAEKASSFVTDEKLPLADSIIYSTAILNDAELLTLDNDFRNLPNVNIL